MQEQADCRFDSLLAEVADQNVRGYIENLIHSDLATEPSQTSPAYGLQNYLMNDPAYMQLYSIEGGNEPTIYWQKAIPISISMPFACLFLAICYFSLRKIGPDRRLGIEGWMRWLCD